MASDKKNETPSASGGTGTRFSGSSAGESRTDPDSQKHCDLQDSQPFVSRWFFVNTLELSAPRFLDEPWEGRAHSWKSRLGKLLRRVVAACLGAFPAKIHQEHGVHDRVHQCATRQIPSPQVEHGQHGPESSRDDQRR